MCCLRCRSLLLLFACLPQREATGVAQVRGGPAQHRQSRQSPGSPAPQTAARLRRYTSQRERSLLPVLTACLRAGDDWLQILLVRYFLLLALIAASLTPCLHAVLFNNEDSFLDYHLAFTGATGQGAHIAGVLLC